MKLNWGSGIAIFYSLFVILMIFMVIKSKQNQAQLVDENYYQKDLSYEEFRQKRQNAVQLGDELDIQYIASKKHIQLSFPKKMYTATGHIVLFRPSNKFLDKKYKLRLSEEANMYIPIDRTMAAGLWRIQLDWKFQDKSFYKEQDIVL